MRRCSFLALALNATMVFGCSGLPRTPGDDFDGGPRPGDGATAGDGAPPDANLTGGISLTWTVNMGGDCPDPPGKLRQVTVTLTGSGMPKRQAQAQCEAYAMLLTGLDAGEYVIDVVFTDDVVGMTTNITSTTATVTPMANTPAFVDITCSFCP